MMQQEDIKYQVASRKRRVVAHFFDHFAFNFLMVAIVFLIVGCGILPTRQVHLNGGGGRASMVITVLGQKEDVKVHASRMQATHGEWTFIELKQTVVTAACNKSNRAQ